MTTTLVMQNKKFKHEISKLLSEHRDWDVIETDNYSEAIQKIQTGGVDALAVAAEVPCGECVELVSTMKEEKPEANIYVIMNNQTDCDLSKSVDRGFLYA